MKSKYLIYVFFMLVLLAGINACKKSTDEVPVINPYDKVDYGTVPTATDTVDPNSIVGLHRNIFSVKCANPGCHDGSFEPDYRTIESTYNSLVWNPVIKNTSDTAFKFRVVPYNYQQSWLHERITTSDQTLGRMPLYAAPLSTAEIDHIKTWIGNGARDMFGNSPRYPNSEPAIQGYLATNTAFNVRYDTARVGGVYYNSFYAPASSSFYLMVFVNDDSTATGDLINNKIKLSLSEDNYTTPLATLTGQFIQSGTNAIWLFTVNPATLPQNQIIYFRYFCNDGDHANDTQFPTTNLQHEYKTYYSFIIP